MPFEENHTVVRGLDTSASYSIIKIFLKISLITTMRPGSETSIKRRRICRRWDKLSPWERANTHFDKIDSLFKKTFLDKCALRRRRDEKRIARADGRMTSRNVVQGVKDKIGLKASDVDQGLKICIHGQFYILNWFRRVAVLTNQQEAVKCTKYTAKYAKTGLIPSVISFNYFFTYKNDT